MASAAERRAAQRQLARNLREGRRTLPPKYRAAYESGRKQASRAYAREILDGNIARPAKGSEEGRVLARAASHASRGEFDDDDYDYSDLEEYWYHDDEE